MMTLDPAAATIQRLERERLFDEARLAAAAFLAR